ncbi:hypothetical protein LJB92_03935 [Bacteroidales bacterium OttesenSCG-928-M06]|nr:hypothetical protein [Bacteroidales bacterium OttesenSCG-928-M06]
MNNIDEFLLLACYYYKGEQANPYEGKDQDKAICWFYESKWVEFSLEANHKGILANYVNEYNAAGLYDFERKDGTPKTLKALLYNRYIHWCCGDYPNPLKFKVWYKQYYKPKNKHI